MYGAGYARMIDVPQGFKPIWEIPVFECGRDRFALMYPRQGTRFVGQLNSNYGQRLTTATWKDVRWTGTGYWMDIPRSFLALIAWMRQPHGWREGPYKQWQRLTPAGLIKWFTNNGELSPVHIESNGDVVYQMKQSGRRLVWQEGSNLHGEIAGTLMAIFDGKGSLGLPGSCEFLLDLVLEIGFPEEMLEPIEK